MAEKIGFISFSAFDLQKATEFTAIKRKAYDTDHPTRSFFERNPVIPHWKILDHTGNEPMQRHTPPEFQPLMNEYHRYFLERAVQHENYLRWVRRHRAWDREAEVYFGHFTELRDFLNDKFASEDYARRGRLHQIYDKAAQKTWLNSEMLQRASEDEILERKRLNAKTLQKKLEEQAQYRHNAFVGEVREAWKARDEVSRVSQTTHENRIPLNVPTENSWAHGLAMAHYQQQVNPSPIPQATLNTNTAAGLQSPMAPPIVRKVNGLG